MSSTDGPTIQATGTTLPGSARLVGPWRTYATAAAIALAFVAFAARLGLFIDQNAVNVLFWDQWDYLQALREHVGAWRLFSWQHGPHRMGLGYFFIAAMYAASGWDDRVEAFATGGVFVLIAALALLLKRIVVGRFTWLDISIPALLLTTAQFELFIGAPNAAHGPIPLLLVVISPFCWLVRNRPLRALLGSALAFSAAFTGFAIFLVVPVAALFFVDAFGRGGVERVWDAAGGILSVATLALFFRGYQFVTVVDCFRFPDPHPSGYVPFAGLAILRPMRLVHIVPLANALGAAAFALAIATTVVGTVLVLRRRGMLLARTVFLFSWFTVLFIANMAVGRVCLGPIAALASRYVPYVAPLWLVAYFALARAAEQSRTSRWCGAVLVAACVSLQALVRDDVAGIRWYAEGKRRWRACFRKMQDEPQCNESTRFRVYPTEREPHVARMMEFLRENRLNLFKP